MKKTNNWQNEEIARNWRYLLELEKLDSFILAANTGKINEATGTPAPYQVGSDKTPISSGLSEGYHYQDIAFFYIFRETEDFEQQCEISKNIFLYPDKIAKGFNAFMADLEIEKNHFEEHERMDSRIRTGRHNVDFLKKLSFKRIGNRALFQRGDEYFLSPAIAEGEHGRYFFDIRQANLNIVDAQNSFLLPRIVPNLFFLASLNEVNPFLSEELREHDRGNSNGSVWGLRLELLRAEKKVKVFSKRDSSIVSEFPLLDKLSLQKIFERQA